MATITKRNRSSERHRKANEIVANGAAPEVHDETDELETLWRVVPLLVGHIDPNPFQPRVTFDPEEMSELVATVRAHGVLQPVTVRTVKPKVSEGQDDTQMQHDPSANGQGVGSPDVVAVRYELVTGERRLRACKEARRKTIPAIIRDDLSDAAAAELSLVENLQRSSLNVIEEASGYKRLMIQFRMKEERIAKKVGKSVQTIKDTIRLLSLPESVQGLLAEKKLTPSHGQQLLRLSAFESACILAAELAVKDGLTAVSLVTEPLSNVHLFERNSLVVPLDYRTKFNWQDECGDCPHKAYLRSGHGSYCLQPEEWKKKNQAAIELQKQEAARVLEEARSAGRTEVEAGKLPSGSYRDLRWNEQPAGCSTTCACRGKLANPEDPTRPIPICLDPKRHTELVQAEREAQMAAREQSAQILWRDAVEVLRSEFECGDLSKTSLVLCRPILNGENFRYGEPEAWTEVVEQVARDIGMAPPDSLPEAEPNDDVGTPPWITLEPQRLLLLTACVLLAEEARDAVHYSDQTPEHDFVLGRSKATQPELPEQEGDGAPSEATNSTVEPADADTSASSDAGDESPDDPFGDGVPETIDDHAVENDDDPWRVDEGDGRELHVHLETEISPSSEMERNRSIATEPVILTDHSEGTLAEDGAFAPSQQQP